MRRLGLGLVLWALGAAVASAAVLRIEVIGTPTLAEMRDFRNYDNWPDILQRDFDLADIEQSITRRHFVDPALEFLNATSGWVEIDIGQPTPTYPGILACSGLLAPMCAPRLPVVGLAIDFVLGSLRLAATDGSDGSYLLQNSSFNYVIRTCGDCRVESEGVEYRGTLIGTGLWLEAEITSLRYSFVEPTPVPLPATAPLLLSLLLPLGLLRHRARRRRA